jgi:ATP synthase protein I
MTNSTPDPDKHGLPLSPSKPDTSALAERIRKAQEERKAAQGGGASSRQSDMSALARGLRIGTEFVAAILVGTGIGYVIDQVAGTGPWAMLVLFMLGFAAGILNVTRVVAELSAPKTPENGGDERNEG